MVAAVRTVANMTIKEKGNKMSGKTEKRRRRFMREKYTEKINGSATLALRREIFCLARVRDILGLNLIFSVIAIMALSILLFRHW
jgi:hypothetical protein